MRESKQLCNTDSAMNVINEKGQRIKKKEKKECRLGVNHKFPMQCVDDVLRDLKTLHVSQPIYWNLKWHFLKKQLCPFQGQQALKHQIAACSLLFMEVWISVIHAMGPRGSSQHLYQFTQIHTHHTDSIHGWFNMSLLIHFAPIHSLSNTIHISLQHMSNKLAFQNLHLFKGPAASGGFWMRMNSKCDLAFIFLMMFAGLLRFIMPCSRSKLWWDG